MKIAVGLSGGVDSAVAALLLKEQGHEVTGISMSIWDPALPAAPRRRGACLGPDENEELAAAAEVCRVLQMPFRRFDCAKAYEDAVLANFRAEYAAGRTPNPCVRCNQTMKFGLLPVLARQAGVSFDVFATGHYARVERQPGSGRWMLLRAADRAKDQSYFLYRLTQAQLAGAAFPLGELRKTEVRRLARVRGLPVSEKPESQDFFCGDWRDLLGQRPRPGRIVDLSGRVLGEHEGYWNFTPGQRKGLPGGKSGPFYVVRVDSRENVVTVGSREQALCRQFSVSQLSWVAIPSLEASIDVTLQIRSSHAGCPAAIEPMGRDRVRVEVPGGLAGVSPGQAAVFYDRERLLGGGTIER